jgi:hypothetical protein
MAQVPHLSGGRIHILVDASPEEASQSGAYFSAVDFLIREGDTSRIETFRGRAQRGLPFETDPDVIEEWWLSTDFDFLEEYEK